MPGISRGPKNGNWKGGRTITSHGYVLIRVGINHPLADCRGYAYEHRLVAARKIGRRLRRGEIAHHKDENKRNNARRNLKVMTRAWHRAEHRKHDKGLRFPGEPNTWTTCACGCGRKFRKFDRWGRPRVYVSGHNGRERG